MFNVRFPPIADISELEETVPMAPLQRLFRFIDWDLGRTGYIRAGAWSLFIGLLIVSIPLAVFSFPYDGVAAWAIAVAIGLCLIWFGFVAWRALRLIRASAIKGDRSYDRQNKYKLAVDYHSTESETSASRRKGGDQL